MYDSQATDVQIISDSDSHPVEEDAAYAKTQDTYRSSEAQQLIQQMLVSLIKKSNVAYYVHA